jgi:ribosome biogenesis GTPase
MNNSEMVQENNHKALVVKSTGSWYALRTAEGELLQARIKGKFKIDADISSTNPIAVGDEVIYEVDKEHENAAIINYIAPRKNYIVRVSPHNRNHKHIIAANLDCAILVATIAEPRTSLGFIDRFLLTAEAYHIPAVLVINKTDLLNEKQEAQLARFTAIYQAATYTVFPVSSFHLPSLQDLKRYLQGKRALFCGHSGVGKSTLINCLLPKLKLRTKEVSGFSGKGQHTTTFAEMFLNDEDGAIIDTPGVKEFGLIDVEREEISHYFPEMKALMSGCRFNNCMHVNEPGCAVKEALIKGSLYPERYESYLSILNTLNDKW